MSERKGMPKAILNQINENSGGCYFLFHVNEQGEPYFSYHLDNDLMFAGMLSRLKSVIDSLSILDELEGEGVRDAFLEAMGISNLSNGSDVNFDDDDDDDDDDISNNSL